MFRMSGMIAVNNPEPSFPAQFCSFSAARLAAESVYHGIHSALRPR